MTSEQLQREAVLLIFCDPLPRQCARLEGLSNSQWRKLLRWLDISGLALYFLDRIVELQRCDILPPGILERLQQSLHDNVDRTQGMAAESVAIQQEFQRADLLYATLKGFSLCPESVPKVELRHQFDLDFLTTEECVPEARRVLESRGYRLYAISGKSWEFKINEAPVLSLRDMYKDSPGRNVELHIAPKSGLLDRIEKRDFHGIRMPVLSPVDLFLGQGLHVCKHVYSSEFARMAHLLEFRRHVLFRYNDDAFWGHLQSVAEENPRGVLGLGMVTQLITRTMGDFAPEGLTNWTADRLPRCAQLWINMYGRRVVLDSFPGSKLYLLLQKELESTGVPAKRSWKQKLLPGKLPPAVIRAAAREALPVRARRYRLQLSFVLGRLRFHIVEGFRYARESHRWRQHLNGVAR